MPGRVTVQGKPSGTVAPGTLNGILDTSYSAYVPDLPGCVAVGETLDEVQQLIREAVEFHLAGMREDGIPVPPPSSQVDYNEVAA